MDFIQTGDHRKDVVRLFSVLLDDLYKTMALLPKKDGKTVLYEAPVYELLRAIVHLAHAYEERENPSKAIPLKQYEYACSHLERGILDAWKLMLFDKKVFKKLKDHKEYPFFKDLLIARMTEYKEILSSMPSGDKPCCKERYSTLNKDFLNRVKSLNTPREIAPEKQEISNEYFEALFTWTRYELLLSTLQCERNLNILKHLVVIVKNENITKKEIEKYTGIIALEIIKSFRELGLDNHLVEDPVRYATVDKAMEIYEENDLDDASAFIDICRKYYIIPFTGVDDFL